MPNFYRDNHDLQFYVQRCVDWEKLGLLGDPEASNPDELRRSYEDILELVGGFVAEEVAPYAVEIDRQPLTLEDGEVVLPPRLARINEQVKSLELYGMAIPRELGGMACPSLLQSMVLEIFARGDVSVLTHFMFHGAMAQAMLIYSLEEGSSEVDAHGRIVKSRFTDEIAAICRGEAWGSMDITEANAGSDMAALRARAVLGPDGVWRVTGEKIFITSGHGKYHFVIARTEPDGGATAGLNGLSLFLVPAYEDDDGGRRRCVSIERIEHKLGHNGSPTCALVFDDSPAQLIGERGNGFHLMLTLMNGARLAVGFEALGLCEAAARLAREYAAQRQSMGKTLDRHELIADYFDEMEIDIRAVRALAVHGALNEKLAHLTRARLKYLAAPGGGAAAELRRRLRRYVAEARRVTPLVKYMACEKAVDVARRTLQIHGGVGYTTEYGAERLLREAMVMPIYEGTSQIQALMAMKDTLGAVLKNPQDFVLRQAQARWRAVSARDVLERRVAKMQSLALTATQHILSRTASDKLKQLAHQPIAAWAKALRQHWDPKRDFSFALLHAERLTRLLSDAAMAEVLLQQAKDYAERRELLAHFLERAEPRCRYLHDEIASTGERLIAQLAGGVRQSESA